MAVDRGTVDEDLRSDRDKKDGDAIDRRPTCAFGAITHYDPCRGTRVKPLVKVIEAKGTDEEKKEREEKMGRREGLSDGTTPRRTGFIPRRRRSPPERAAPPRSGSRAAEPSGRS